MPYALKLNLRHLLLQFGIALAFILMMGWVRLVPPPFGAPDLNATRFALLWVMLATTAIWAAMGAPGFATLCREPLRAFSTLALLLLSIWAYASQAWAFTRESDPNVTTSAGLIWCVVAIFILVVTAAGQRRLLITLMIAAGSLVAIVTLVQVARQSTLGLGFLGEFQRSLTANGGSILQAGDWRFLRPSGFSPHPNMLGGLLTVCTLLATARAAQVHVRVRIIYLGLLALIFLALLVTFSRSAWLALAVAGLSLLLMMRVPWHRWLPVLLTGALVAAVFLASYWPLIAARAGVGEESIELRSVADRIVFTDLALRAIAEQPLIGQGAGAFPWRSAVYISETFYDLLGDQVHQVFMAVWAELGFVGLALFATGLLSGIMAGLRRLGQDRHDRAALLAAVIAFAVIGLFDHYPYSQLPFIALWWGCVATAARP